MAGSKWQEETKHAEIRRVDVLHRLFDGTRGTGPGAGAARLRVTLGAGAFAYSAIPQIAVPGRGRPAEEILRHDGSVRDADRGSGGDQDADGRRRSLPGGAERPDPDGEAAALDRPGARRPLPVRYRQRLEPGRTRRPRRQILRAA